MGKIIRNTAFTLAALALTAIGLHWNNQVTAKADPVQISQTVLSAAISHGAQPFALTATLDKPRLKLGEYQELHVATVANASLKISTIYPNGTTDNPQTLAATADETGQYTLKFKLDDFAQLGVFETRVIASSDGQQAQATARFALQTLIDTGKSVADGQAGYVYPLLP